MIDHSSTTTTEMPTNIPTIATYDQQLSDLNNEMVELNKSDVVDLKKHNALLDAIKKTVALKNQLAKSTAKTALSEQEENEAVRAICADIRQWLKVRDFRYTLESDRFWLSKSSGEWIAIKTDAIKRERTSLSCGIEWGLFMRVMREDGRYFDTQTYTFNDTPCDVLNLMRMDFVKRVRDGQEPHWLFDTVVGSIGGGKADNVEHIKKLILAKYQHPENMMLPALVLQDRGGTGKGLFVTKIVGTIFNPRGLADNLKVEDVAKNFNEHLVGKAVWFINETASGKYNMDDLKRKIGSTNFMVEPKGVKAFSADMTALIIISGNDFAGSVKLAGGGVDRRFSVVVGGRPLPQIVAEKLNITIGEADAWIQSEGQHILSDPVECGRWIASLEDRFGDIKTLGAHHGDDYLKLAQTQRDVATLLFEAVLGDHDFEHIKLSTLYDYYCDLMKGSVGRKARGSFYATAENWAETNDIALYRREMKIGSGRAASKAAFFTSLPDLSRVSSDNNSLYFTTEYGKRDWLVDIG